MSRQAMAWALKIDCPMDVQGALLRLSYMSDETGALVTREKLLRRKFGEQAESSIRLMLNYLVRVGALTKSTIRGAHEGLRLQLRMDEDPNAISERIIDSGGLHAPRPRRIFGEPTCDDPDEKSAGLATHPDEYSADSTPHPDEYSAELDGILTDSADADPAEYSADSLVVVGDISTKRTLRLVRPDTYTPTTPLPPSVSPADYPSQLDELVSGDWLDKWALSDADVSEMVNVFRHKVAYAFNQSGVPGDVEDWIHIRVNGCLAHERERAQDRCQKTGRRPPTPRPGDLRQKVASWLDREVGWIPTRRRAEASGRPSRQTDQERHDVSQYIGVVAE